MGEKGDSTFGYRTKVGETVTVIFLDGKTLTGKLIHVEQYELYLEKNGKKLRFLSTLLSTYYKNEEVFFLKTEKFCQSCGMPLDLEGVNHRGTEADGSQSIKYCSYCYENGKLLDPDMTFNEMLEIGKKGIDQGKGNKLVKIFIKLGYPYQLKHLERWKNQ